MRGFQFVLLLGSLLLTFLPTGALSQVAEPDPYRELRATMVRTQIEARGVRDERVLAAMREVPRHLFVEESDWSLAYLDTPFPIGSGQTISQPYIVALMTELLQPESEHVVLEIGTGSGYQAAVLAELVARVYTIEIVPELGQRAGATLARLGYDKVTVRVGDGYQGWPEQAPFDRIIVTAAPETIPQRLVEQLKPGGRMVLPVGPQRGGQDLLIVEKDQDGNVVTTRSLPVRFVPMVRDN
jgi:protein-L-isoaspartate(D-aspartate) O-methyltransferase